MKHYGQIRLSDKKTEITEKTNKVKNITNELYSSIQITQCYANTIIEMNQYKHSGLPNLPQIYDTLNQHSQIWNATIKPNLGNCIAKLRSFYAKYRNVYDNLKRANGGELLKNKEFLLQGLRMVQKSIGSVKTQITETTAPLKDFSEAILNNKQSLTDVIDQAKTLIEKNDSTLIKLKDQMQEIEDEINTLQKKLIAASVFTGLGILAIIIGPILIATGVGTGIGVAVLAGGIVTTGAGGGSLGSVNSQLLEAKKKRKEICNSISEKNKDSAVLTNINTNFSEIITKGNEATIVANNLFNGFEQTYKLIDKVQSNAQNLSATINVDDPSTFELMCELNELNDSFETLKTITAKYETNFILPVQTQKQFTQNSALLIPDDTQPFLEGEFAYNIALANCTYLKNPVSVK